MIEALEGNIEEINKPDLEGNTPIYIAAYFGYYQVLQMLITAVKDDKTETNRPRNDGATPLYAAAYFGHVQIVNFLVWTLKDEPEAINFRKSTGETALFTAAQRGHHETVRILIQALHAAPDLINTVCNGKTPLWIAAHNGHLNVVFLLLKALQGNQIEINKTGANGKTALLTATENGHLDVVGALLYNNADVNKAASIDVDLLLTHKNNRHCYFALKEFLCQKGFSKQIPGCTPLQIAVVLGHFDLVARLLNHRASTNAPANSLSLFDLASAAGHRDILLLLTSTRLPPIQQLLEQGFFGDTSKKRSYQQMDRDEKIENDENTIENENKRIKPRKLNF